MRMLYRLVELLIVPVIWAAGIFAALSLRGAVLAHDHSVCGPWGCGPSTDTLLAMHGVWAAAMWPPLLFFPWRLGWRREFSSKLGARLAFLGLCGVIAVCAWQWLVWRADASELVRPFIWQRCLFVLIATVDWPIIQTLII